jgi:arylformamidase
LSAPLSPSAETWPLPADRTDLRVVDLAQPIHAGMAGWRGTERTVMQVAELDIEHDIPGGRISGTHLTTPAHAGTHVDAARHFFPGGHSIDQYGVERFACRATALDVRRGAGEPLGGDELRALDPGIEPGDGLLLYFGFAERYEEPSYYDHPYLTADAADYLLERRINVLGVDMLTPDCPHGRRPERFDFPVHTRLLGSEVLVIENLGPGVATLLGRWFLLAFAPLRLEGSDASPIAPVALVREIGR